MSYYQDYSQSQYYGYNPAAQGYTYDQSQQGQNYGYAQTSWQQQASQQPATQQTQAQPQQQHQKRFQKPKNPRDTVSIHCDICELNCLGQDAYNAHMVGRKHAAAAKRKAAADSAASSERYSPYPVPNTGGAAASTPGVSPQKAAAQPGKFYCEMCNVYSTDLNTFNLHLNGRKHLSAQQARGGAPAPSQPTSAPSPADPSAPSTTAPAAQSSTIAPAAPQTQESPSPSVSVTIPTTQASPSTPSPSNKNQSRTGPVRTGRFGHRGHRFNKSTGPHVNTMPVGKNSMGNNYWPQPQTPSSAPRSPPSTLSMAPTNSNEDNFLAAKHAELSPSAASAMALAALVRTISNKLSEIGKKTDGEAEVKQQVVVSETKLVGSYAKGTMLKGNLCADIVAITQAPPTHATLEVLYNALTSSVPEAKVTLHKENAQIHVQENDYNTHIMVTWLGAWRATKKGEHEAHDPEAPAPMDTQGEATAPATAPATEATTDGAAAAPEQPKTETTNPSAPAVTDIVPSEAPAPAQANPPLEEVLDDVNIEACQKALLAIRQMMWFNEHSMSPNIRSVMRLVLDFRSRNEVFQVLSPWTIEIIVAHALRTNPPNSSISQSLRSVFAYMASGVLLPGIELIDPCQQESVNVLSTLSAEERLGVTALSQELIRDIAYGKWERVVGPVN